MRDNTYDYQADRLEFVKNPVIAEFLGFSSDASVRESKLEGAIIANLQQFLLELGKGYAFVARQQHIRTDAGDFFIDLVFYNIILKCYVLIDLKVGQIAHQDVGQMDMCVRMYDELRRGEDDNPTLGIVLCSETMCSSHPSTTPPPCPFRMGGYYGTSAGYRTSMTLTEESIGRTQTHHRRQLHRRIQPQACAGAGGVGFPPHT